MFLLFATLAVFALSLIFLAHKWLANAESSDGRTISPDRLTEEIVEYSHVLVGNALATLAQDNVTNVCRIQRTGSQWMDHMSRQRRQQMSHSMDRPDGLYISHMMDSAGRLAKSARDIATRPGYSLTISMRCELRILSDTLNDTTSKEASIKKLNPLAKIALDLDLVEQLIADTAERMRYEDFRDESTSYAWLILLLNLHAFINAYHHVCAASLSTINKTIGIVIGK